MKPIKLTEEIILKMAEEFAEQMRHANIADGKVSYTKSFTYSNDNDGGVTILFEPVAFAKMLMVLHTFDSEVAWHGIVERPVEDTFVIKDILVYPQEVTGATVNTDQEGYTKWLISLDDDVANAMHMQAHSHVNMPVSPSSVDLAHQEEIIKQLSGEFYYIFMIWNKRMERNIKVYDMASNTLYENADVSVGIAGDGADLNAFIDDAKKKVVKRYYTGQSCGSGYGLHSSSYGAAKTSAKEEPKKKPTEKKETKRAGFRSKSDDDDDLNDKLNQFMMGEITDFDEFIYGNK